MKIIFATNNPNKLAEIRLALGDGFGLVSLSEMGFDEEIPETGNTLESNALQKAQYIFDRFHVPVFADDSGLEVEALNGLPGVDTAHYSGTRDPQANMAKLLKALEGKTNRNARFRTIIAFVTKDGYQLFEGEVKGVIAHEQRGQEGFGYDPIFIPEGREQTFAELGMEEKAKSNHRVRAFGKFMAYLKGLKSA
jgi:XTP/dITP diphosphohydrolase